MNKFYLFAVLFLICVGFLLRFYKLGEIPNGLTWDEAAIGYNSWSISKNLKDEHGEFMPMVFKSFGDFKPPVYIYLTTPFVWAMGLSEVSTRILSVISGIIGIVLIYLFVNALSGDKKWGLAAAIVLTFSPWHIFYSRGAWETNLMTTFLLAGLLGLVRASRGKSGLWWGLGSLFMAMMTYQAGKLYVPLILVVLFISGYLEPRKAAREKIALVQWSVFLILCAVLLGMNLFTSAGNRLNRLSIFNYKPDLNIENKKYGDGNDVFHNLFDLRIRLVASRYLTHYSTDFLFLDNKPTDRGHLPKVGVMYWVDALFVFIGFFGVVALRDKKQRNLLLGLLIVSAIPGALTLAEFSSTRNLFMIVPLSVLSAKGVISILERQKLLALVIIPAWFFCFIYFWDVFMIHSNVVLGKEFNIGYKKVFEALKNTNPERAVVTDVYGQPYIYYLFYGKIDPIWYQKQGEYREQGIDVGLVGRVGNVEFRQFEYSEIARSSNAFFAGGTGNYVGGNLDDLDNVEFSDQVSVDGQEIMFKMIKTK